MEHKIFDDYYVDCNECQHYWNDTCDGVPTTKERKCTSFMAIKKVDLPKRINRLEEKNKILGKILIATYIWLIVLSVYIIFGGQI